MTAPSFSIFDTTTTPNGVAMEVDSQVDVDDDGDNDVDSLLLPSVIIPITSSETAREQKLFIEIFPEEMAHTPVSTLLQVLKDETAELNVWADASLAYMQHKHARESLMLLEEAAMINTDDKDQRVRVLAATGIAHLAAQQHQTAGGSASLKRPGGAGSSNANQEGRDDADRLFTQASKVDTFFPMTWIGRGMLNLICGRLDQARFFFQTTLKQCGPVLPALLGMAAVLYGEADYKGALQKYSEAIQTYPTKSGAPARVGFGLSCYKLGQVDRAKAAFDRALAMDPECVEAMVGTALLGMAGVDEYSTNFSQETEKAIKMLSMANLLDHSNAMVQNHLANHYFWKWTPVTGTVFVTKGSKIVKASQPMPLDRHERIRIGTNFESTVVEEEVQNDDGNSEDCFRIQDAWRDESTEGLKVWKKDYDRVTALAKGAYGSTQVPEIQAESLFFLARVYHVREETDHALKFYERATKLAPDLTPARFGLAQTLVIKEQYEAAMGHLNEILSSTNNAASDALALLGLLEVRSGGKKTEDGLAHLRKAIELDPLNPQLLIMEALALQQQRTTYSDALERYKKAIDLMHRHRREERVPYNVYVNSGVLCHEIKKYDEAMTMYKLALEALDNDTSSGSGSGADDSSLREPTLDNVGIEGGFIRQDHNNMFCGFVDSSVLVERDTASESKTVFKVVSPVDDASAFPLHPGDRIRIGDFISEILNIDDSNSDSIILEVKDEFAVPEDAEGDAMVSALAVHVVRENQILNVPEAVTVAFNIARLHEAYGRTVAAIELHKAILKRNPGYVNSSLRLACIAVDCGSLKECGEWLKIAAATSPGNPEVLTLIGNLHLSLCDWAAAQPVFDGLLMKKIASVEAYAALSLGNIYFANLHVSEKRYGKHLQHAADFYRGILSKDPANAYAANGIGSVLAEKGEIFKAKEIFNRVREVSGDTIADALLNLGHIYLAQKKNSEALQLYQQYKMKIEDTNTPVTSKNRVDDIVDVELYMAFAYFDWARHKELLNDAGAAPADGLYKHAMEHLQKGLERNPKKEVILKYNLAMTKLQAANCVLQKSIRNIARTVEEVQEALDGLEESLAVVQQLLLDKSDINKKVPIPTSALQNFLTHCKANLTSAKSHLDDEKRRAAAIQEEQDLRRLAVEAEMKEAEIREAIKKQEEAKAQEARDRKAESTMRKVEVLRTNWQKETQAEQVEKEKKKKRSAAADMSDFIVEERPDEEGGGHGLFDDSDESDDDKKASEKEQAKEKPKKIVNEKELFGDSDESDDDNKAGEKEQAKEKSKKIVNEKELFGDSDDDDDEAGADKPAPKAEANKGTNKAAAPSSKDLFGDSDDESDEEFAEASGKDKSKSDSARKPSSGELFGSDDESDEELLPEDKRAASATKSQKKRKAHDDGGKGKNKQSSNELFGSDDESDEDLVGKRGESHEQQRKKQKVLDDDDD